MLDVLRFAAALVIVLYHFGAEAPVALADFHPAFGRGYLATDFFLILSGFVLGRAYGGHILSGRIGGVAFVRKRLMRVWPAQLMVLLAMALIVLTARFVGTVPAHPENFTSPAFLQQVLMVHAWGFGGGGWNQPSWSLSALLVCYAAFPLGWRWICGMNPSALLALGLSTVMIADLICLQLFQQTIYDLPLGVVRAAPLFMLGICIARTVETGAPSEAVARVLPWSALVVLVTLQIAGRHDLPSVMAIVAIVLGFGRLPVSKPSHLLQRGADLAFALFITHALTGLVWFGSLRTIAGQVAIPTWAHWGLWAFSIPLAVILAVLFHRFVDAPVQAWIAARKAIRDKAADAPAVAWTAAGRRWLRPRASDTGAAAP
jgi:peptidoglycan/LPS O-acetylase OafA/YrhL